MLSTEVELPFHPNPTDQIFIYGEYFNIENILIHLDEDNSVYQYIIELQPKIISGDQDRFCEEVEEMASH